MSQEQSNLAFLYEAYETTMAEIRDNRKTIKENQKKNQKLQAQLKSIKDSIVGLLEIEIAKEGTLYKVCQKEFGKIDKRFYRICSMVGSKL